MNASGREADSPLSPLFLARISAFGFGYTALAGSFTLVILPVRILEFAPAEHKNSYLGLLSIAGLFLAILAQLAAGTLSDRINTRWGRRAPFIAFTGLLAAPLIVAAVLAPNLPALFALSCALQLVTNIGQGPYQALVRDYTRYSQRGAASGMKWLVEIGGAMGMSGLASFFVGRHQDTHQSAWLWAAGLLLAAFFVLGALVTAISIARLTPEKVPTAPRAEAEPQSRSGFPLFLGSRFLLGLAVASIQTYAFFYLRDHVGLANPASVLWKVTLVVGVMAVLVAYPAGRLADRWGRKPLMLAGCLLAILAVILLLNAENEAAVLVVAALTGIGFGLFLGANWALASDLAPSQRVAQSLAIVNLATIAGAGLGKLNGLWVDVLDRDGGTRGYTVLFVLCAILFAAGSALLLAIRTPARSSPHAPSPL